MTRRANQNAPAILVLTPSRRFAGSDVLENPGVDTVRRLAADGEMRTRARLDELRALAA